MRRAVNRGSDGQNQLEYIGLVVLVAVVVGVLVASPVLSSLPVGLRSAVCKVLGREDCPEPNVQARPHEYYRPEKCLVSESKTQYGASVSVIATIGGDVALVRKEMSDGTVHITAVQMGKVGIEGGVGADIQWGKVVNAGAEANVGVNLKGELGKTWVFPGAPEADQWVDNIKKNNRIDAAKKTGLVGLVGGGVYDYFDDSEPPMDPRIRRYKVGIEAYGEASGNAGIGLEFTGSQNGRNSGDGTGNSGSTGDDTGTGGDQSGDSGQDLGNPNNNAHRDDTGHDEAAIDPELSVGLRGQIGGNVIVEKNTETGDVSSIFQYKLSGEAGGTVGGQDTINGVPIKAEGSIKGAMKVTRTSEGKIKSIQFQRGTTVNDKLTLVTTKLNIDSPRERRIASQWVAQTMTGFATQNPAGVPWLDTVPTGSPAPDGRPMQRLLYREANVTRAKYHVSKSKWQGGLEGKYGVKFGLEGHKVNADKKLLSSKYLGAPRAGRRGYVAYTDCS